MIVRNEEATLPRLAASVAGEIDYWTVVDTGSTDRTVEVARSAFAAIPGQALHDDWRGFAASRNVALEAAEGHTDWLLSMDADEALIGRIDRKLLVPDLDAVVVRRRSGATQLWLPRLLASGRGWRWHGRTHEYLEVASPTPRYARAAQPCIDHHGDGGSRSDKYERDLVLLQDDWAELADGRSAFYMARTYDDLGRQAAAVQWYRTRAGLGGFEEERWYASYRLGACLIAAGEEDNGCRQLWEAWQERPQRAEPLAALAEHYRTTARWDDAWRAVRAAFSSTAARPDGKRRLPDDWLLVDLSAYAWRIAYEGSISAWYVGEKSLGLRYGEHVLASADVPELVRAAVRTNRRFYR
jgi:hypothetical protein